MLKNSFRFNFIVIKATNKQYAIFYYLSLYIGKMMNLRSKEEPTINGLHNSSIKDGITMASVLLVRTTRSYGLL